MPKDRKEYGRSPPTVESIVWRLATAEGQQATSEGDDRYGKVIEFDMFLKSKAKLDII